MIISKSRKILSVLSAAALGLTMMTGMMTTAFAGPAPDSYKPENCSIVIANGNEGATYDAYRLMNLTTSWNPTADTINYAYTVNDEYSAALYALTSTDNQRDLISALEAMDEVDANPTIRDFADELYLYMRDETTMLESPEYTGFYVDDETPVFTNVEQGYYLIVETTEVGGQYISRSFTMVDTMDQYAEDGVLTITSKEDVPTVEKKIFEDEDDSTIGWNDVADYDINDTVSFRIRGTMPDVLADYDVYRYVFHDSMDDGLTFLPDSVEVKVGDQVIDDFCYDVVEGACDATHDAYNGECTFTIGFDDVKTLTSAGKPVEMTPDSIIEVTYDATLNENAICGNPGNENDIYLEFSNNPYELGEGWDQPGDTGNTPKDTVVCFTYSVHVDKIDQDDNKLNDVHFRLYADADCTQEIGLTKKSDTLYVVNGTNSGDEIVVVDSEQGVMIKGLEIDDSVVDDGVITSGGSTYYLKETAAPDGFNALINPVVVQLGAEYTHREDYQNNTVEVALAEMAASATVEGDTIKNLAVDTESGDTGNVYFSVVNTTGERLPMTGEFGGAIMMGLGALALVAAFGTTGVIIVKRRKNQ